MLRLLGLCARPVRALARLAFVHACGRTLLPHACMASSHPLASISDRLRHAAELNLGMGVSFSSQAPPLRVTLRPGSGRTVFLSVLALASGTAHFRARVCMVRVLVGAFEPNATTGDGPELMFLIWGDSLNLRDLGRVGPPFLLRLCSAHA